MCNFFCFCFFCFFAFQSTDPGRTRLLRSFLQFSLRSVLTGAPGQQVCARKIKLRARKGDGNRRERDRGLSIRGLRACGASDMITGQAERLVVGPARAWACQKLHVHRHLLPCRFQLRLSLSLHELFFLLPFLIIPRMLMKVQRNPTSRANNRARIPCFWLLVEQRWHSDRSWTFNKVLLACCVQNQDQAHYELSCTIQLLGSFFGRCSTSVTNSDAIPMLTVVL
jgi:hypothetical protein